jgi:hypothetical protein
MKHIIPVTETEKHVASFNCDCNPFLTVNDMGEPIIVHGSLLESHSDQIIDMMNKEVSIEGLKNELFKLANKFACEGLGKVAVTLHSIHNSL